MGKAGVDQIIALTMGAIAVMALPLCAHAQSRMMSYATEADCAAGHILTAGVCKSAFANARAEFVAKTPAFPTLGQCAKTFGACSAWPAGRGRPSFRPQWSGVDIVDTPHEKSVTPAFNASVKRIGFAPLPLTAPAEERELVVRAARQFAGRPAGAAPGSARVQHAFQAPAVEKDYPPAAVPPPGSGFKMEDGVLTYPAPARFAPKNLPKQP